MLVVMSRSSGAKLGGLESIKYYVFDGENKERWHKYYIKTSAFADVKRWREGLTKDDASKEHQTNVKNYLTMSLTGKAF